MVLHVVRMNEFRMARRVLMAEVSRGEGGYERDRGSAGWMV